MRTEIILLINLRKQNNMNIHKQKP